MRHEASLLFLVRARRARTGSVSSADSVGASASQNEGRKKALIQKTIKALLEFDEDQLDIAEMLLIFMKGKSLAEGIWLMDLVSAAFHYPETNADAAAEDSTV